MKSQHSCQPRKAPSLSPQSRLHPWKGCLGVVLSQGCWLHPPLQVPFGTRGPSSSGIRLGCPGHRLSPVRGSLPCLLPLKRKLLEPGGLPSMGLHSRIRLKQLSSSSSRAWWAAVYGVAQSDTTEAT